MQVAYPGVSVATGVVPAVLPQFGAVLAEVGAESGVQAAMSELSELSAEELDGRSLQSVRGWR